MFSQVQQALECLSAALDGVEAAPTGELRQALGLARSLRTRVELLETKAASLVARRECHGDGGAGLLNQVGGRSRSEAARNVRADAELAELPAARTGLSEGEISFANAAKLAGAARKTSPQAVQDDADLVQMAKTLPDDEFAQAAQRWTIRHQSVEDLAAQHRRNRRNRSVRFWNGDDGSVQMRGAFDAEMGARIQNRLRHEAEQLRQADRRQQRQHEQRQHEHGAMPDNAVRTCDQRMADALDRLLEGACTLADSGNSGASDEQRINGTALAGINDALRDSHREAAGPPDPIDVWRRRTGTEIIVRADLEALLAESGGIAEIPGVGPIPPSTLERLICNSDLSLVIFADKLTPLYETTATRAPTAAQRRALIARDGACIGCGALPGECEAHHVIPWKLGGKTRVDNLVLVCWSCHDRIHDHNWRVIARDGRYRLAPPDPAHRENPARSRKPRRSSPQPSVT